MKWCGEWMDGISVNHGTVAVMQIELQSFGKDLAEHHNKLFPSKLCYLLSMT